MAQVNLGYLKITPKNIFDPKKHFHPFFLYVNLPLRLFKTQIKTFHIFSQKLLIAPLVHHCVTCQEVSEVLEASKNLRESVHHYEYKSQLTTEELFKILIGKGGEL